MPEERGLYPKMKVAEQVAYFGRLHGLDAAAAARATDEWIERLGLAGRRGDAVEKLSLGNQQRVQLAAALVSRPEVLILDEPFSGLDPVGVDSLAEALLDQCRRGVPVVFSSHQLDLVERLCDSVGILARGHIVATGTVDELRQREAGRLLRVVVPEAAPGWAGALPGVRVVSERAGDTLLEVTDGADDQGVLAAAVRTGRVAHFGWQQPTLVELFREAVAAPADQEAAGVIVAIIGIGVLSGLLILFGQFVAQGVVEEKSSRVVELLLATMKPWQLLAGKIVGLGLLGLAQIVVIAVVGVAGALAFDLVDIPGELIGTAVSVVLWFVLGYAFYAAIFAVAASLVSRQEDLAAVIMPTTLVLVVAFIVGIQASASPDGALARITSYVPGLSPLVMPVRQAAGDVAVWEIALAVVLMLIAIALIVRVGGRVYAGALLRTGGRTKVREALRAERV
jgi:ABC-2 type transport system ATP-binding protein